MDEDQIRAQLLQLRRLLARELEDRLDGGLRIAAVGGAVHLVDRIRLLAAGHDHADQDLLLRGRLEVEVRLHDASVALDALAHRRVAQVLRQHGVDEIVGAHLRQLRIALAVPVVEQILVEALDRIEDGVHLLDLARRHVRAEQLEHGLSCVRRLGIFPRVDPVANPARRAADRVLQRLHLRRRGLVRRDLRVLAGRERRNALEHRLDVRDQVLGVLELVGRQRRRRDLHAALPLAAHRRGHDAVRERLVRIARGAGRVVAGGEVLCDKIEQRLDERAIGIEEQAAFVAEDGELREDRETGAVEILLGGDQQLDRRGELDVLRSIGGDAINGLAERGAAVLRCFGGDQVLECVARALRIRARDFVGGPTELLGIAASELDGRRIVGRRIRREQATERRYPFLRGRDRSRSFLAPLRGGGRDRRIVRNRRSPRRARATGHGWFRGLGRDRYLFGRHVTPAEASRLGHLTCAERRIPPLTGELIEVRGAPTPPRRVARGDRARSRGR